MNRFLMSACVAIVAIGCALFSPAVSARTQDSEAHGARSTAATGGDVQRSQGIAETMPIPGVAPDGVRVRVFLPLNYDPKHPTGYNTLYVNDGQDAEAVMLRLALEAMSANVERSIDTPLPLVDKQVVDKPVVDTPIMPVIAIAIDAPNDRLAAYGFSDRKAKRGRVSQSAHGAIGARAHAYSEWLTKTLVPTIDARYRTRKRAEARAILGWSLGGANALSIGWQYPEIFGRVGAFSPSLWLSTDRGNAAAAQRTRIAQAMIANGEYHAGSRFFFAVGNAEETDDRDSDGIIDVVDDIRDLLDGWRDSESGEPRQKGLRQLGHSIQLDHAAKATRADASLLLLQGGEHQQTSWALMLPSFLAWAYGTQAPDLNATGRSDSWQAFPSAHVAARDIDIWLPPSYGQDPKRRYPVLYMHDGQNLFDPLLSYTGVDWDIDGAMTRLIARGEVREAIVVGIWNTPQRFAEYMPRAPVASKRIEGRRASEIVSDDYLRFLVEELKPFIDTHYRTRPGREDTAIMGSSMGGLISLYAGARYPEVFGGVGAVSTHWPVCDGCVIDWLKTHLPEPGAQRIYYDHGTATLDAKYPPFQAKMDAAMRERGYREDRDWDSRRFEGAEHNEAAWKARVEVPLKFLLAPQPRGRTEHSFAGRSYRFLR